MEGDSSLGDLSKMKYHNKSIDIDQGRGEFMMGYPIGPVNAIPKLPILSTNKEMHKYTPMSNI
jgi:hypothetical protein